ncbi:hypothetical protein CYLTODRAFT_451634 [Cylindrobasidium torrendii FP15055 ss-10]|uniref:Uncharacterized protein n=1 Tax=Cylindrobasidium torrendii FP15055 ss-10 TaxID=1314674 RepID=A0A0D7BK23_9AGAR|nr:hypothetical protein CYLTODRAFT_451634 [Cylindrobasidium torrendii FP15055 ss-10]
MPPAATKKKKDPFRLRDVQRQLQREENRKRRRASENQESVKLFDFLHPDSERLAIQDPDLVIASALLILLDSFHESNYYSSVEVILSNTEGFIDEMVQVWNPESLNPMDHRALLEAYGAPNDLLTKSFGTNAFRAAYCGILSLNIWPSELLSDLAAEEEAYFLRYVTAFYEGRYGLTALTNYNPRGLAQTVKVVENEYERHHGFLVVPEAVWDLMEEIFEDSRNEIKYKERKEISREKFEKWKNSPERYKQPSDTPRARHLVERDNARELVWRPKKAPAKRSGSPLKRRLA